VTLNPLPLLSSAPGWAFTLLEESIMVISSSVRACLDLGVSAGQIGPSGQYG
jgi:hypothetical protein